MDQVQHVLVIDDDNRIRELLGKFLVDNGFFVTMAKDAQDARKKLADFQFDILVLDIMMPGETGFDFTKYLRQTNNPTPILMLTAMGDVEDRINGLECGADDYLPKPFEPRELLIRIKRIIDRFKVQKIEVNLIKFGNFEFNTSSGTLSNSDGIILLTSNESRLIRVLCDNIGQALSRQALSDLCGGINERSIDVQITRLRNKIEIDPKKPRFIKTVRGQGYALYHG